MNGESFFSMGGYGAYIWPCYAIALTGLAAYLIYSLYQYRRNHNVLKRMSEGKLTPKRPEEIILSEETETEVERS
jgi:heme exporter protein D